MGKNIHVLRTEGFEEFFLLPGGPCWTYPCTLTAGCEVKGEDSRDGPDPHNQGIGGHFLIQAQREKMFYGETSESISPFLLRLLGRRPRKTDGNKALSSKKFRVFKYHKFINS